jgi:preprotein translocase subunit SecA
MMQMNVQNNSKVKQELKEQNVDLGRNDPCPCGSDKKIKKCDCKEYVSLR